MPATLKPTALSDEHQAETAADAARALMPLLANAKGTVALRTPDNETIAVPMTAFRLFIDVLTVLANGDGVVILPEHAELSTQQAADLLNVSRPFIVELVDSGKLPGRRVGTHRRVLLCDLLAYKRRDDEERERVLAELARSGQDLGLGY
jgi:excisionase family DNA binding protein